MSLGWKSTITERSQARISRAVPMSFCIRYWRRWPCHCRKGPGSTAKRTKSKPVRRNAFNSRSNAASGYEKGAKTKFFEGAGSSGAQAMMWLMPMPRRKVGSLFCARALPETMQAVANAASSEKRTLRARARTFASSRTGLRLAHQDLDSLEQHHRPFDEALSYHGRQS